MNLFNRLSELLAENLSCWLDRPEPAEALLARVLRAMTYLVDQARARAARAIAVERRLARELERHRAEAERRQTLLHAREQGGRGGEMEARYTTALLNAEHARASLRDLEARLACARWEYSLFLTAQPTHAGPPGELERNFAHLETEWLALLGSEMEDRYGQP